MIVLKDWTTRRPGDFVYDQQGKAWKILARHTFGELVMVDAEGHQVQIPKQSGMVRSWDPDFAAIEEFRVALGATIVYDSH